MGGCLQERPRMDVLDLCPRKKTAVACYLALSPQGKLARLGNTEFETGWLLPFHGPLSLELLYMHSCWAEVTLAYSFS